MKASGVAAALLLMGSTRLGWADAPGANSFDFLKLGASPRQVGMGEAGVGLLDETGEAQLNPAALAGVSAPRLSFFYNKLYMDVQHGEIGYASPTSVGKLAADLQYLDYGTIAAADSSGTKLGAVSASDRMARLSWASGSETSFLPGASLKVAQEILPGVTATAFALDAGLIYRPRRDESADSFWARQASHLSFGGAVRNLSPGAKFETKTESLPLSVSLGAAHRSFADALTFALDLERATGRDQPLVARFGFEDWVKDAVAIRLGARSDRDAGLGLSFGVGLKAGDALLDYAMEPSGVLGFVHRIGLSLRFGGGLVESYYDQGLRAMREGDNAQAVLLFDKALTIDPGNRKVVRKALEAAKALSRQAAEPAEPDRVRER